MSQTTIRGLLVSDFNIDNLASYLNHSKERSPNVEVDVAPFGNIHQVLLDPSHEVWKADPTFAVIWTRPEGVIGSFRNLLAHEPVSMDQLLDETRNFRDQILNVARRVGTVLVPTWTAPTFHPGHGLLDGAPNGVARALMKMNLELLEGFDAANNVYSLLSSKWLELAGKNAFNPRLWYMGKIPYGPEVFKLASADILSALNSVSGATRKVIICDLDDTLWGGIVGDIGWENLALGGHDPVGEALVDFQSLLKGLSRRGILLAIASKNDESVALGAIENHPEMVLRKDDFSAWRINWNDKAQNIADMMRELNLGLNSAVFLDDNPVERARVKEALPEVLVPDWPKDKRLYPSALTQLDCFNTPSLSAEDLKRREMYAQERGRDALKTQVASLSDWLETLAIQVTVEPLSHENLTRASQLLNKTNQMNLRTRRMNAAEFMSWAEEEGHAVWTFTVEDKFGASGLTGILSLSREGGVATVEDFVLSCRVMGRGVEETMLWFGAEWARDAGLQVLQAIHEPTPKNRPCLEFFEKSAMISKNPPEFTWDLSKAYPPQTHIQVVAPTPSDAPIHG